MTYKHFWLFFFGSLAFVWLWVAYRTSGTAPAAAPARGEIGSVVYTKELFYCGATPEAFDTYEAWFTRPNHTQFKIPRLPPMGNFVDPRTSLTVVDSRNGHVQVRFRLQGGDDFTCWLGVGVLK